MKYIGLFDEKEDIVTKEKLETKQDKITGAATTITDDNLTASHALVSDANGKVAVSDVTSTELGYLDGVTSNVQTQLNKKLETVHDNDMLWGGKNLHGEVSPTDAAMVSVIGGNKFALCKPQGITIEYTNDGGATWVDYEATEKTKIDVISGISAVGLYYGKKTESSQIVTADDMLRITVNALNCGVYTSLRKILVGFATNGGTNNFVKIESATIGDQETFTVVGTYNISENTGWNSIPYSNNVGAYSLNQTSNIGVLRFTFSTGTASSYQGRPYVQNLILNGITNYVNPSKLSSTGHLYSYDYQQNATFPANVTAEKFIGDGSNLTNISYPVTSVNTKTGAVTLSASDVGAQPTITVNGIIKGDGAGNLSAQDIVAAELVDLPTVPTKVSELANDANYITAAQAPVTSVNNKTGAVSLTASDVGALPADTIIPTVNNATLTIKRNSVDVGSFTANAANDVSIDINVPTDKSDIGLGNVDNVKQYSATNPPPYPVTSVNSKTGAVTLLATDVSAIPSTLSGTAGQVLTKTADGQEWADAPNPKAIKITLTVAEWNSTAKTQSVTVPGVSADATKQEIRVMPVNAALDSPYIAAGVQCVAQAANSLTFACETVPTEAIEVYVVMQDIIPLFATITVYVKSGVYVILQKDSTTIDSKESTGTAVFTVMETGTYRVIVSTESASQSKQLTVISSHTAYEVFFDNFE